MRMYPATVRVLSRQRFAPSCVCMHSHVHCFCAPVIWMVLCTFMCVHACKCMLLLCACYLDRALHLQWMQWLWWLLSFSYVILMNKCCLKNFVPFDQVKYGGVTYIRMWLILEEIQCVHHPWKFKVILTKNFGVKCIGLELLQCVGYKTFSCSKLLSICCILHNFFRSSLFATKNYKNFLTFLHLSWKVELHSSITSSELFIV